MFLVRVSKDGDVSKSNPPPLNELNVELFEKRTYVPLLFRITQNNCKLATIIVNNVFICKHTNCKKTVIVYILEN